MKNFNEKGYALVTVLLIVTVFMLIFLSFMGQAFSSVKQNQIVEKNVQSTAIAEMGMTYYQTAVKNTFLSKKFYYDTNIGNLEDEITEIEIADDITDAIKDVLQAGTNQLEINDQSNFGIIDNDIYDIEVINDNQFIDIKFSVIGTVDTNGMEETILSTEMNINLENLNIIIVPTTVPLLPNYVQIQEPKEIDDKCIDPGEDHDFKKDPCLDGILITKPNQTYTSNFQNYVGTIYARDEATGVLTLAGVGNKSSLTVRGDSLYFKGNQNNIVYVTMEAKGNVTFGSTEPSGANVTASYANFFIGGDLTVDGKFELKNDTSTIYHTLVRGDLKIPKNQTDMVIEKNNIVCVNGNFSVTGWIENNGTIYVDKDKVDYSHFKINTAKSTLGRVIDKDEIPKEELIQQCGNVFEPPGTYIEWGTEAQTMVDIVDYK